MSKTSNNMYKASIEARKVARFAKNVEDLSKGDIDKVVKREVRSKVRKEANKGLNKVFKKIGL